MVEPTIICPKCKSEIKLTESLAAPLIESTRQEYEQRLVKKDMDIASREQSLKERESALCKSKEDFENQLAGRLQQEREKITVDESRKAKLAFSNDLEQKAKELSELQELIRQRDAKLAEAQHAQANLIKKQR